MTTNTIRPNGTIISGGASFTGGATWQAVTSDDSDASYATLSAGVQATLDVASFTLDAGNVTKQWRVRARVRSDSGTATFSVTASMPPIGELGTTPSTSLSGTATTTITTFTGTYIPLSVGQTDIDAITLLVSSGSGAIRWVELYVDVIETLPPTVSLVNPTGTLTTSTMAANWSYTQGSDGGPQSRYHIKAFAAEVIAGGGFDPNTSTALFTTGEVASAITAVNIGPITDGIGRGVYIRVAQSINGVPQWSAWDSNTITIDTDGPGVTGMVLTPSNGSGSIEVEVNRDTAGVGWDYVTVQRAVGVGAITFPGSANNFAWTPDATELDITGDITLVVRAALDDWTPSSNQTLIAKRQTVSATYSFTLAVLTTGRLSFTWSSDGTNGLGPVDSTVSPTVTNGLFKWLAFQFDVNNGAGGKTGRYWQSNDGVVWAQLGADVTTGTTTSIFSSTSKVEFGSVLNGGTATLDGKISDVSIRSGLGGGTAPGGAEVFAFSREDLPTDADATEFTAATGQLVFISRSGSPATTIEPGGTDWQFVRGATSKTEQTADQFVVVDYEAPNGLTVIYRARGETDEIAGPWFESASTMWFSEDTWLKHPGDSSLNMILNLLETPEYVRERRTGVFNPLGRKNAVVVTDVLNGFTTDLVASTATRAEKYALIGLLEAVQPVLLQLGQRTNCDETFSQTEYWIVISRSTKTYLIPRWQYSERGFALASIQTDRPSDTADGPVGVGGT